MVHNTLRSTLGITFASVIALAALACDTFTGSQPGEEPVAGVELETDHAWMLLDETKQLEAEVEPDDATIQGLTWFISDDDVATVDENGELVAGEPGRTTVAVVTDDGAFSASASVRVTRYGLGDRGPAGGHVFYVDHRDEHHSWTYLAAAPQETEWVHKPWGGINHEVGADAEGEALGDGRANTAAIVSEYGTEEPHDGVTDYAARLANNLEHEHDGRTYDSWYLPSIDELNLMYENLRGDNLGRFARDYYWSSSEITRNFVHSQNFGYGTQARGRKDKTYRVRAVRAFP